MGAFISETFSKEFAQRTEENLDYINFIVHQGESENRYRKDLIEKYREVLAFE